MARQTTTLQTTRRSIEMTPQEPGSIAIKPVNPSVAAGQQQQLTATGTYGDGTAIDLTSCVTWSSSANGTATVDSFGVASGVSPGSATITAEYLGVAPSTTPTGSP